MKSRSHISRAAQQPQGRVRPRNIRENLDLCGVDCVHVDVVRSARAALPDDLAVRRMADLLALLASPTRLKILLALQPAKGQPPQELCVCDLAAVSGASKSLASNQLRLLRTAALVTVRRDGKLSYYKVADGPVRDLLRDTIEASRREALL